MSGNEPIKIQNIGLNQLAKSTRLNKVIKAIPDIPEGKFYVQGT